jgi:hypothetical protein
MLIPTKEEGPAESQLEVEDAYRSNRNAASTGFFIPSSHGDLLSSFLLINTLPDFANFFHNGC